MVGKRYTGCLYLVQTNSFWCSDILGARRQNSRPDLSDLSNTKSLIFRFISPVCNLSDKTVPIRNNVAEKRSGWPQLPNFRINYPSSKSYRSVYLDDENDGSNWCGFILDSEFCQLPVVYWSKVKWELFAVRLLITEEVERHKSKVQIKERKERDKAGRKQLLL